MEQAASELSARDQQLLGELKTLRLELARDRGVPAYVVFPDATLIELAKARPMSEAQMGEGQRCGAEEASGIYRRILEGNRGGLRGARRGSASGPPFPLHGRPASGPPPPLTPPLKGEGDGCGLPEVLRWA